MKQVAVPLVSLLVFPYSVWAEDFVDNRSWIVRYIEDLSQGHVDRTHERTIDLSFAVAPAYAREAGIGLGALASGLYRLDKSDSISQPSNLYLRVKASLNGFYSLTFRGDMFLRDKRSRLSHNIELYRKNLDFWGINAFDCLNNTVSYYDRRQFDARIDYVYRLTSNFYIGAQLRANYTSAHKVGTPEYLLNERHQYFVTGLGPLLEIDSRNNLLNPSRGVYIAYKPMLYASALGNYSQSFMRHTFIADVYHRAWKGAVVAYDLYACLCSESTPWTMREMVAADENRMRGYYCGSVMDNNQVCMQVEIRQNIYSRIGVVAWGGLGRIVSSVDELVKIKDGLPILYNYGIGLRIEFKHNVNARFDYGFGRHTSGFLLAIGEAF